MPLDFKEPVEELDEDVQEEEAVEEKPQPPRIGEPSVPAEVADAAAIAYDESRKKFPETRDQVKKADRVAKAPSEYCKNKPEKYGKPPIVKRPPVGTENRPNKDTSDAKSGRPYKPSEFCKNKPEKYAKPPEPDIHSPKDPPKPSEETPNKPKILDDYEPPVEPAHAPEAVQEPQASEEPLPAEVGEVEESPPVTDAQVIAGAAPLDDVPDLQAVSMGMEAHPEDLGGPAEADEPSDDEGEPELP